MNDNTDNSGTVNNADSSGIPTVVTFIAAVFMISGFVWFFGIDLVLVGIGGLLLLALIATGVGAVIVGIILVVMGKPVLSILPLLWLGLKTLAVIAIAAIFLLFLHSILSPLNHEKALAKKKSKNQHRANKTYAKQNTAKDEQGENKAAQIIPKALGENPSSITSEIREDQGNSEIQYPDHTPTKQCPKCAETIRLEALVCRFCDHKFDENEVLEVIAKLENEKHEAEEKKQKALQEKESEKNKAILLEAKKRVLRWNTILCSVYKYLGLLLITIGSLGILIFTVSFITSPKTSADITVVLIFYVLFVIMAIIPGRAFQKAEKKRLLEIARIKNDIEGKSSKPNVEKVKILSTEQQTVDQKKLLADILEGNWAAVSTLLRNGVKPIGIVYENGLSPLDVARKRNDIQMIKLLKSYGAY